MNCIRTFFEGRIFGLFLNNFDNFLDGIVLLVQGNETSLEVFKVDALDGDFVGEGFKVNLGSDNLATAFSHEDTVDKAQAKRLLGNTNKGSILDLIVVVEEVLIGNVEVGVSLELTFFKLLEVEDEHFLELVQSVVVKRDCLQFSE